MKRLFYYSGHRLTVFHWINGKFSGTFYFNPDAEGQDDFRHYLRNTPNVSARLLVDVIEEDFRIETIPHLRGADRTAVIKRLNERYYRSSRQYTYHEVQGREEDGRRDDIVLMSALTNIDLIRPWLDIMKSEEVPVNGMWSLPHVSKKVLSRIDARSGHVLLISQQVSSNVRQTYFRDGKLMTSRSAAITLEGDSYGKFLSDEIDQTARFLTNKRHIGFDEILHIHIIAGDEHMDSVLAECQSSPLREVSVHRLAEVEKKVDTQGISGPFGNGIFAQLCMEDRFSRGHYGNREDFEVYHRNLVGWWLQQSAQAMILLSLLAVVYLFIDMNRLQEEAGILAQQAASIDERYEQELKRLEPRLKVARKMKATVDTVNYIEQRKRVSPQAFFVELSHTLSGHELSLISIREIEWQAIDPERDADQPNMPNKINTEQLQARQLNHFAKIKGRVPVSAETIRQSVDQVNRLAEVLRAREDVLRVVINKLPIDVRSTANLSLQAGLDSQPVAREDSGLFTLTVTMRVEHATWNG